MMHIQGHVICYLAAEVKAGNKRYFGINLWPVFVALCQLYGIAVTLTEPQFRAQLIQTYIEIATYERAATVIYNLSPTLRGAPKALAA